MARRVLAISRSLASLACALPLFVSTATLVVALAAQPVDTTAADKQVLEVFAQTNGKDQVSVLLRCGATSSAADGLKAKQPGNYLIISGDLTLENNQPVVFLRSFCEVPADVYINEVTVVGRLVGEAKVADSNKSARRSIAVSRWSNGEETTDWFTVRGYGYQMDKLLSAPKGSLVAITGSIEQRTNRDGQPYAELKGRNIRVYERGRGDATAPNMAAGTKAYGYEHKDFDSPLESMPGDWSNG
jgi:single-stranded DNA-binding protein